MSRAGAGTTPLSVGDWARCFAMASLVLWADELKKLLMRWLPRRAEPEASMNESTG